ncbi:MAG: TraR/DksA C4-type zinc finger protein [Chloroflexi bacterium]|nr:TraR/DksA C4-type zinc finger protein [Chloroflexota bacterium]
MSAVIATATEEFLSNHWSKHMYEQLKTRLLQEREGIRKELDNLRVTNAAVREAAVGERKGMGDHAAEAAHAVESEKSRALESSLRDLLAQVDHALAKFEAGSYGLCDDCGKPISPERLEALPHAHLCIQCKSRREKINR